MYLSFQLEFLIKLIQVAGKTARPIAASVVVKLRTVVMREFTSIGAYRNSFQLVFAGALCSPE